VSLVQVTHELNIKHYSGVEGLRPPDLMYIVTVHIDYSMIRHLVTTF